MGKLASKWWVNGLEGAAGSDARKWAYPTGFLTTRSFSLAIIPTPFQLSSHPPLCALTSGVSGREWRETAVYC
jgi:hypothetical protein